MKSYRYSRLVCVALSFIFLCSLISCCSDTPPPEKSGKILVQRKYIDTEYSYYMNDEFLGSGVAGYDSVIAKIKALNDCEKIQFRDSSRVFLDCDTTQPFEFDPVIGEIISAKKIEATFGL